MIIIVETRKQDATDRKPDRMTARCTDVITDQLMIAQTPNKITWQLTTDRLDDHDDFQDPDIPTRS